MTSFVTLLQQGHSWLFVPSAVLLGALHGLEPGHSKTMMAAFIVAIRGTLAQAVLLALSATASHTAIVWVIALAGLRFGRNWSTETSEPYFQVVSAVLIVAVAAWMLWRTRRQLGGQRAAHAHDHGHGHSHGGARRIDTGHGIAWLEVHAQGAPPRFRLHAENGAGWPAGEVEVETERADTSREQFHFRRHGDYLESVQVIPEPHEFVARLRLGPAHHRRDYDVEFVEGRRAHAIGGFEGLDLTAPGYQDPHELAHANDIRRRFADRDVTTAQIVVFGLTGGLVPCPASITVLLLCLQLKKLALGGALVLCFSVGLALTLVTSGAVAALGVRHAAKHFRGFGELARRAPYFSGALILLVGVYVGYQGLHVLI
ncbi:MAG TPA: nickel/cobalt efflux transporter [Steroidobacteraceae bacterium]|jgi:nickel/cobalt exporter|nr:nickel/cobalt efflux transporter [Steroidobacteraceae bacterium]